MELEAVGQLTTELDIRMGLGYEDAKITAQGISGQAVGSRIYQVPQFTAVAAATYTRPVAADLEGFLGLDYSYTGNARDAWLTVLVMDVWHWTPLVALLCFAGLRAIPDAYYQAASIDGASKFAVFRYIQLPKLRGVLMIAVLLRFMDSFMIYTEPFVLTGGGPGNATTFLSQYLTQKAVGQFDLGPAAAFSLIYFLIILLLCFILYNWMQRVGTADKTEVEHG